LIYGLADIVYFNLADILKYIFCCLCIKYTKPEFAWALVES